MKIRVLRRDTLEELTSFGDGGRQPGQFYAVHSIADRFEGQPLHDGNLGGNACRSSSTRDSSLFRKGNRGRVASMNMRTKATLEILVVAG